MESLMDTASISAIVMSVFSVLQPYLSIISSKLVEKIGEKIPDEISKLWHKISSQFNNSESGKESIDDLMRNPDNQDIQASFRVQLKRNLEKDDAFKKEIIRLIEEVSAKDVFSAKINGDGAIAQGRGAKSVGANGILLDGNNNSIKLNKK